MKEYLYKEYSDEESHIYDQALPRILQGVKDGLPFDEACDNVPVENGDLKAYIVDDALKILIAELHYNQAVPLMEIASQLEVSEQVVEKANKEMVEDVSLTASEVFRAENPDAAFGNA